MAEIFLAITASGTENFLVYRPEKQFIKSSLLLKSTPLFIFCYRYIPQHGKDYKSFFLSRPSGEKAIVINTQRETRKICHFCGIFPHRLISHTRNWGSRTICPSSRLSKYQRQNRNPSLLTPIPPARLSQLVPHQRFVQICEQALGIRGQGGTHS